MEEEAKQYKFFDNQLQEISYLKSYLNQNDFWQDQEIKGFYLSQKNNTKMINEIIQLQEQKNNSTQQLKQIKAKMGELTLQHKEINQQIEKKKVNRILILKKMNHQKKEEEGEYISRISIRTKQKAISSIFFQSIPNEQAKKLNKIQELVQGNHMFFKKKQYQIQKNQLNYENKNINQTIIQQFIELFNNFVNYDAFELKNHVINFDQTAVFRDDPGKYTLSLVWKMKRQSKNKQIRQKIILYEFSNQFYRNKIAIMHNWTKQRNVLTQYAKRLPSDKNNNNNFKGHLNADLESIKYRYLFLPPNCIDVLQPLDLKQIMYITAIQQQ
ncbi:hypothetical protein ABPG74_000599 [Tetrahymena malaccensis]